MIVSVAQAVELLKAGDVVGMPTETVYGLAARIDNPEAIKKIFQTKERPFFDPLIVHVASQEQAQSLTQRWGAVERALAAKFWPGPLTMVLPKSLLVSEMITSGLESVGVRMPSHPLALEMIQKVGVPLAAPSANKFGRTSPTLASHVESEFQGLSVGVVEGGPCQVGIESTVLLVKAGGDGIAELSILRKGAVEPEHLKACLEAAQLSFRFVEKVDKKESPGHMKHHYMPPVPFVIVHKKFDQAMLADQIFKQLQTLPDVIEDVRISKPARAFQKPTKLQLSDDPSLAAREFYGLLREVVDQGADLIFFEHESKHKLPAWEALMDRMHKAASLVLP